MMPAPSERRPPKEQSPFFYVATAQIAPSITRTLLGEISAQSAEQALSRALKELESELIRPLLSQVRALDESGMAPARGDRCTVEVYKGALRALEDPFASAISVAEEVEQAELVAAKFY